MISTRLLLAVVGVVVCAPAHASNAQATADRTAPRPACAITVSRTSGHLVRNPASAVALFRVTVADAEGKPIGSAGIGFASVRRGADTDARGEAVLTIPAAELPVRDSTAAIVVRRVGYAPLRFPISVAPGDDLTIRAVLCAAPIIENWPVVRAKRAETPRGRIIGLVRDSASGRVVPRSWVMASVHTGSYRGLRFSQIDSTGAYRIDSVAGIVHVTVECAIARGFSSKTLLTDSVTLVDSSVHRRDWSVDATGCDARPVRRVTGTFRGHYTGGFEADDFVPCAADAWFIPGDSLGADPFGIHTTAVRLSPEARRTVRWPVDTAGGPHRPRPYYVRWHGTVVGPGDYYMIGGSMFSLWVDSVLEVREPGPRDCSSR